MDYNKFDYIIVGAGFAGATIAERVSNELNKKVLLIDKREHVGGNMYDYFDENGILIHKYGPHLFHTNYERVYNYLSKFTKWFKYEHRVLGKVQDKLIPIPFNITSIEKCFDTKKSEKLIKILKENFGEEKKIPILKLKDYPDKDINELAEFIYENVFLYYTMKQWGQKPDEIDQNVTNRVPVFVSKDDRYFQDKYQYMPADGYAKLFENMLSNNNITIKTGIDSKEIIRVKDDKIYINDEVYNGKVVYTGAVDELLDYKYGKLPYRTLEFNFKTIEKQYYQPVATVNFPTKEDKFTRITEYKHMTMNNKGENINKTVIMEEYPKQYSNANNEIPYYPINNDENDKLYSKYLEDTNKISNLYLLGRLAQYKYFNMDLIINEALNLFDKILEEE